MNFSILNVKSSTKNGAFDAVFYKKDADVIFGLYRESYYNYYNIEFSIEDEIEGDEIIVVKNRHGNTGTVEMSFDGRKQVWEGKQSV